MTHYRAIGSTILLLCLLVLAVHGPTVTGGATFSVGAEVLPVRIDWHLYSQPGTATVDSNVTLHVPTEYFIASPREVSALMNGSFSAAIDIQADEDWVRTSASIIGTDIEWNATPANDTYLLLLVPPPRIAKTVLREDEFYNASLVLEADTPLRNASYAVSVLAHYKDYALYEHTGARTLRTLDYSLSTSGSTATFTNIAFTEDIDTRLLYLEAIRSTSSSSGGGGGGGAAPQETIIVTGPDRLEAEVGSSADGTILIENRGTKTETVEFTTDDAELETIPQSLEVPAGGSAEAILRFTPVTGSHERDATVNASWKKGQDSFAVRLFPIESEPVLTMSVSQEEDSLRIEGETTRPGIEHTVLLRVLDSERVERSQLLYQFTEGTYLSARMPTEGLGPGDYMLCAEWISITGLPEECVEFSLPLPPVVNEPSTVNEPPRHNQGLFQVLFAIVAVLLGAGAYGIHGKSLLFTMHHRHVRLGLWVIIGLVTLIAVVAILAAAWL